MIARCPACDQARRRHNVLTFYGFRWHPDVGPLADWRCPRCGGFLRAPREGEVATITVNARYAPAPREPAA